MDAIPAVSTSPTDPGGIFVRADAYTDLAGWHAMAARFRREAPVHRVEIPGWPAFWALTRHADVWEVERNPGRFPNTMRSVLMPDGVYEQLDAMGMPVKSLVQMDGPEHDAYRLVANDWFKPANLRRTVEAQARALSRHFVDRMMERGDRCDFAREIGLFYPLRVIMTAFGVPEEDEARMLHLTQRIFGSEDPEFGRGDSMGTLMATLMEFAQYFQALTEDRRATPRDDIATVLANATIGEVPIGEIERFAYYLIVATAGHDTTSGALNGGVQLLARHPDQLAWLRQHPEGIDRAVDEILRYATPVRHFLRHATEDCTIRGTAIRAGDVVLLSYPSANRDEDVFADPMRFDVRRENAGDHITFGTGVHFCLGAHLARLELRVFLRELIPRLDELAIDGTPAHMVTNFVGGPKTLPVRYRLRPAA